MRFEVGAASSVVCTNLGSLHLVPHFGMSALQLKCTKHMGHNRDVVQ